MTVAPVEPTSLFRLDGKVVLLTGASSGIGARMASVLDAAGATVALVARRADRLEEVAGSLQRAVPVPFDVGHLDDVGELVGMITERHGRIDVLVNNAGVTNVAPATKEPVARMGDVLGVNLLAPFALAQAVVPAMRAVGGGSIINVASVIARISDPTVPQASYAASKAGLVGLTRELAVQWARYSIRVNALAPGWFPTEMTNDITADPDLLAAFGRKIPMGRLGRLEELDGALLFLASAASTYVTAQVVEVDGGITAV